MIDFDGNKLQGNVPRSLLSLGFLIDLTKLQALILRSNKFYGAIESPKIKFGFPNLRIIDLSHNGFTRNLPAKYFQNCIPMKFFDVNKTTYMGDSRIYWKPQGLQVLNLSNNDLSGRIPSCLGNLINLESLDFSQNKLSGEIPQQLTLLTFLEFLNVSNNNLTGPIPHGKKLSTFKNNSYEGNLGLCGEILSRKCGKTKASRLNLKEDNDSTFPSTIDWIVICEWDSGWNSYWAQNNHMVSRMVHQDLWKEATQAEKTENERTWKPKLTRHCFAISSILLDKIV
ncbi:hypothetical protein ACSBR2_011884 [Camellia fascicularis]